MNKCFIRIRYFYGTLLTNFKSGWSKVRSFEASGNERKDNIEQVHLSAFDFFFHSSVKVLTKIKKK